MRFVGIAIMLAVGCNGMTLVPSVKAWSNPRVGCDNENGGKIEQVGEACRTGDGVFFAITIKR